MTSSNMWTEVRHLLWLQRRLMRSSLSSGGKQDILRILGYGLLLVMMVPGVLAFNGLLVWVYRLLDPLAAAEVVAILFSIIILSWLLTPVSNTQLVESFNLPRLFQQPISLSGLITGSMAVNVFSIGFLTTLPFALAVVAGMTRSLLSFLPILLSALLFLAAIVVIKSLIDDIFDLIAEDRRLRMIAIMIALLPIVVIYGGQLYFQFSFLGIDGEPDIQINSVGELNQLIVSLNLSRYLVWQPGGWLGRAVGAAATGAYGSWLLWTACLLAFVLIGYAAHYWMLRRLYFGELVRVQVKQRRGEQRLRASVLRLPFLSAQTSEALWGLLGADWRGFLRNPYTIRMAIAPVLLGLVGVFMGSASPMPLLVAAAMVGLMAVFIFTMSFSHNIFGVLDNPGLATVLLAPIHPRLLLLSHNVLLTSLVLALAGVVGLLMAVLNNQWMAVLVALGTALGLQLAVISVCNLTSIFFPYKVDLEKGRAAANESRTSAIAVFGVMGGSALLAAPAVALVLVPLLVLKQAVAVGIVLAAIYLVVVYVGIFFLAGRALEKRGDQIVAAISQAP